MVTHTSPQFHVVFDNLFETVNCIGVDDHVVESICNGLFQRNQELYAEDKLDEAGNIIYQPLGSMKQNQNAAKVTRIVPVSAVEMRI